jgi:hypothetical protein
MAPEQAGESPDSVTTATDVYGLGGLLYFALTARPPFDPTRPTPDVVAPSRLLPAVPRDLDAVCLTCLSADPSRRYASPADLAADLLRFLNGEPVRARTAGWVERTVRTVRRNPLASALTTVALAGVAAAGFFAYQDHANTCRLNADLTAALDREEFWDRDSGQRLLGLDHPAPVAGLALSPDGRTLATACFDGVVRLWSARSR